MARNSRKLAAGPAADDVSAAVGLRVRAARTALGLTLDQLATASGVSRRMIVNIEAGSTNATLATLLRLTGPLRTSLAALVEGLAPNAALTPSRARDRKVLWRGRNGGTATMVASAETPDMLELWEWILQPGELYESEWHQAGAHELIHVHSGGLTLTVGSETIKLRAGDAISFVPDEPHSYANNGRGPARFSMTVYEPIRRLR